MNILLAGPSAYKSRGGTYYSMQNKLLHGFIRNGASVVTFSDRDIARMRGFFGIRDLGERKCNRDFLSYVKTVRPDLLVLCHADIITADALAEARRILPSMRIAEVRVDALHSSGRNNGTLPHLRRRRGVVDHMFVTTAGPALSLVGSKQSPASFIPNPVDAAMEVKEAHRHDDQPYDALYTRRPGQPFKSPDYRKDIVTEICADPSIRFLQPGESGAFGQDYFDLIAKAKIGLNLSEAAYSPIEGYEPQDLMRAYSSDRIAHFGGCGLALMSWRPFALDLILKDECEFLSFDTVQDAHEKLKWLLANPSARMEMAAAGHAAFHQRFSIDKVAAFILAKTMGTTPAAVDWPDDDYGD